MNLDHCHVTGLFRGWLCLKCNVAIGLLGDNLEGLRKAVAYLERFEQSLAGLQEKDKLAKLHINPNRQTCREDATLTSDAT